MRKPSRGPSVRSRFDVLAKGPALLKSRGDRMPIELFMEGVRVWEPGIRRLLSAKAVSEG